MNVAELLRQLGFAHPGVEIDEALRWALIELLLRRAECPPETPP